MAAERDWFMQKERAKASSRSLGSGGELLEIGIVFACLVGHNLFLECMWSTPTSSVHQRPAKMAEYLAFAASLVLELRAFEQETHLCVQPAAEFVSCARHPEHFVPRGVLDRHLVLSYASGTSTWRCSSRCPCDCAQRSCHKEKHERYESHQVIPHVSCVLCGQRTPHAQRLAVLLCERAWRDAVGSRLQCSRHLTISS